MSNEKAENSIFEFNNQFVIYGANGWMGRSAVEFLATLVPCEVLGDKVILIGSKQSHILINGLNFNIVDASSAISRIKPNAIFFNAAFLRREFQKKISKDDYIKKNNAISNFAKRVLQEKELNTFIHLSSGVVNSLDLKNNSKNLDAYAKLKNSLEDEYSYSCTKTGTAFVNCRIYSLTGKYINEFENLALSSFMRQAQTRKKIEVISPFTRRTYVDSIDLAGILLKIAIQSKNITFDSGGALVTFLDLAKQIADIFEIKDNDIILGDDDSPDYFGDYKTFESIASDMCVTLRGLEDQILETSKAFKW